MGHDLRTKDKFIIDVILDICQGWPTNRRKLDASQEDSLRARDSRNWWWERKKSQGILSLEHDLMMMSLKKIITSLKNFSLFGEKIKTWIETRIISKVEAQFTIEK